MGHTITEKILLAHSGTKDVSPGDIVMADLDLVVDLDIVFGITGGHQTPTRVFDPDKIAVVADHTVPAPSIAAANAMRRMREFVEKFCSKLSPARLPIAGLAVRLRETNVQKP